MNRRNQGPSSRHSQPTRGARAGQFNQNSQYGQSYGKSFDQDQDYEGAQMSGSRSRGNFSGTSSYGDESIASGRSSSLRDTDYDLDNSTYGSQGRSPRSMDRNFGGKMEASSYGDYETNDRNREPSRYSSLDEDRHSEFGEDRYSERNASRNLDRSASSSDRFGYPSNMNAWSGADRSYNAGRSTGRTGQASFNSWGSPEQESIGRDQSYSAHQGSSSYGSYGEGALGSDQSSQRGFFGKGPKGYKRSDDRIKEDVCETLARSPRVDASDIEVNVEDACVTLSGTVDTREARRAAEMVIENLSGVDDVKNEIRVKKAGDMGSDSSIHASSSGAKSTQGQTLGSKSSSTKGSSSL